MQGEASATRRAVVSDLIVPSAGMGFWAGRAALLAIGVVALWISAKIQIASVPVPVTMQLFVVLAIGAAFGARLGAATALTYLALGALGEPVFAGTPEKGLGLAYMMGPTGGYLLGFAIAAWVVGSLAERGWDRSVVGMAAATGLGLAAIYVPGVLWLGVLIGPEKALQFGLHPFIWIDLIKAALAALLFPAVWRLIGR